MTSVTGAKQAAELIKNSKSILFTSGAGLGVDSGLPDFRGVKGFWRAYPIAQKLGLRFEELSCPRWFHEDPELAWGFFGHRYQMYIKAQPHSGYERMKEWASTKDNFFVSSNVDGIWERTLKSDARVYEVHGSLMYLQCLKGHSEREGDEAIWPVTVELDRLKVDETTLRADPSTLPKCSICAATSQSSVARPNVLMFGDYSFDAARTDLQRQRYQDWLSSAQKPLVVVEVGAGEYVPTIRNLGEKLARQPQTSLIRINPRDTELGVGVAGVSIASGGKDGIEQINNELIKLS